MSSGSVVSSARVTASLSVTDGSSVCGRSLPVTEETFSDTSEPTALTPTAASVLPCEPLHARAAATTITADRAVPTADSRALLFHFIFFSSDSLCTALFPFRFVISVFNVCMQAKIRVFRCHIRIEKRTVPTVRSLTQEVVYHICLNFSSQNVDFMSKFTNHLHYAALFPHKHPENVDKFDPILTAQPPIVD